MPDLPVSKIAVYWDFENIHISLSEEEFGTRRENRFSVQPQLIDIPAVMDYISSLGVVCVNRAYCNWSYFGRYAEALSSHAVELVQLFPRGTSGKNGADIQMCVDMVEDLALRPHVDQFVIVSGDSDYLGAMSKLRQYGKRVIGIGVRGRTHRFVVKVCDEFKFYDMLIGHSGGPDSDRRYEGILGAKRLLADAVRRLTSQAGVPEVTQAAIKPMMIRLEPSFDERESGFSSFTAFVDACDDVVRVAPGKFDRIISLKAPLEASPAPTDSARTLLVAAMSFLAVERGETEIPLSAVKPMLLRLDARFSERNFGHTSFLAFLEAFRDIVRITGPIENRRVILSCPPDTGSYELTITPKQPFEPPDATLFAAGVEFHWNSLRTNPADTWQEYFDRLKLWLAERELPFDETATRSIQKLMWNSKSFRTRPGGSSIGLRTEFLEKDDLVRHQRAYLAGLNQAGEMPAPGDGPRGPAPEAGPG